MPAVKSRANVPSLIGDLYDWVIKGNTPTGHVYTTFESRQNYQLISHSNPFRNGAYRDGGLFLSMKIVRTQIPSAKVQTFRRSYGLAYVGQYVCGAPYNWGPGTSWGTSTGAKNAITALESRGSEAWAKMRPDQPDFTMASSLYEMKDFAPMFKNGLNNLMNKMDKARPGGSGRKKNGQKSKVGKTAQFYLGLQFGWLPLLQDIRNYIKAQSTKQARLQQLIRDAGQPVGRKRKLFDPDNLGHIDGFDSFTSVPNGYGSAYNPVHVTQCYGGQGYAWIRRNQESKTWCEGKFRYFLPPGPKTVDWKKMMLRRIMNERVTPSQVYNIMPWSWLVDYFTGLGDFIDALDASNVSDRCVADYAYIMKETRYVTTVEKQGQTLSDVNGAMPLNTITMKGETATITKMRSRASPFGWGIKQNQLSASQLAILGALGLSKLP